MVKINWDKYDKWIVYGPFGVYLFLRFLMMFPEPISGWVPDSLPPFLLGLALVGAIYYLSRVVEESSGRTGKGFFYALFPVAFQEWIKPYNNKIEQMSIVAFTSHYYYRFIESNTTKIAHLRLLLFVDDGPTTCSGEPFDEKKVTDKWSDLQTKNQIGKLEIRRIKAQSNIYFSIAESQRVLAGLFWPNPGINNIKAKKAVVFSKESEPVVFAYLKNWFESIWELAPKVL